MYTDMCEYLCIFNFDNLFKVSLLENKRSIKFEVVFRQVIN